MLQVDVDKIMPVTEARDNFNKIIDDVDNTDQMYVLTRNGTPTAVVVGINHLEKLTGDSGLPVGNSKKDEEDQKEPKDEITPAEKPTDDLAKTKETETDEPKNSFDLTPLSTSAGSAAAGSSSTDDTADNLTPPKATIPEPTTDSPVPPVPAADAGDDLFSDFDDRPAPTATSQGAKSIFDSEEDQPIPTASAETPARAPASADDNPPPVTPEPNPAPDATAQPTKPAAPVEAEPTPTPELATPADPISTTNPPMSYEQFVTPPASSPQIDNQPLPQEELSTPIPPVNVDQGAPNNGQPTADTNAATHPNYTFDTPATDQPEDNAAAPANAPINPPAPPAPPAPQP